MRHRRQDEFISLYMFVVGIAKLKAGLTPSLQFKVGQVVRVQSPTTAAGRDQEGFVGKVEKCSIQGVASCETS